MGLAEAGAGWRERGKFGMETTKRLPLEDVQADYICVSVIKLPVSTFELTFVATILGRSMTYDVLRKRFPSNGYHVAQYLSSGRAPCRVHLLAAAVCSRDAAAAAATPHPAS